MDDELEEEVARELQKFGNVQRVLIFEVTEPDFPETESVRIFVKFLRIEEATKVRLLVSYSFLRYNSYLFHSVYFIMSLDMCAYCNSIHVAIVVPKRSRYVTQT